MKEIYLDALIDIQCIPKPESKYIATNNDSDDEIEIEIEEEEDDNDDEQEDKENVFESKIEEGISVFTINTESFAWFLVFIVKSL